MISAADNTPVFSSQTYFVQKSEGAVGGSFVVRVTVSIFVKKIFILIMSQYNDLSIVFLTYLNAYA